MAAYALLIGTKDGKRSLVIDGSPVDIRRLFKTSDGDGFETLEVIETSAGRTRKRKLKAKGEPAPTEKKVAKKSVFV